MGDVFTDPQIHTYDGVGFGQGNLGKSGFEKFLDTHKCNAICQYLELQPINPKKKNDGGTIPRPELDLSNIESSATTSDTPNGSSNLVKRKSWGDREREKEREREEELEKLKLAAQV